MSHLQIRAKVLGDVGAVTLTEDCDLLLNVLDLILGLLQVDDLDGNNALCTIVDTFEHLSEEETCGRRRRDNRSLFKRQWRWKRKCVNNEKSNVMNKWRRPLQKNPFQCDPTWWTTLLDQSEYSEGRRTETSKTEIRRTISLYSFSYFQLYSYHITVFKKKTHKKQWCNNIKMKSVWSKMYRVCGMFPHKYIN